MDSLLLTHSGGALNTNPEFSTGGAKSTVKPKPPRQVTVTGGFQTWPGVEIVGMFTTAYGNATLSVHGLPITYAVDCSVTPKVIRMQWGGGTLWNFPLPNPVVDDVYASISYPGTVNMAYYQSLTIVVKITTANLNSLNNTHTTTLIFDQTGGGIPMQGGHLSGMKPILTAIGVGWNYGILTGIHLAGAFNCQIGTASNVQSGQVIVNKTGQTVINSITVWIYFAGYSTTVTRTYNGTGYYFFQTYSSMIVLYVDDAYLNRNVSMSAYVYFDLTIGNFCPDFSTLDHTQGVIKQRIYYLENLGPATITGMDTQTSSSTIETVSVDVAAGAVGDGVTNAPEYGGPYVSKYYFINVPTLPAGQCIPLWYYFRAQGSAPWAPEAVDSISPYFYIP